MSESEFELWARTTPSQRSFVVEVLHWFHYRPAALKKSWAREEVLTWELLRALEILPQQYFVQPLISKISSLSASAERAVTPLIGLERVSITPYPTLGMSGGKRNCKSDIGLGPGSTPTIWIEAKTASFRADDLRLQLVQQESAMRMLLPDVSTVLVTLLPTARSIEHVPNVSWGDITDILRNCVRELESPYFFADLTHGYRAIASELINRIESHPNRPKGWV